MRYAAFGILIASGLVAAAGSTLAQSNPSADSIIDSLTPRSAAVGMTRGIRPMNPTESVPASPPATPAAIERPIARISPRTGITAAAPGSAHSAASRARPPTAEAGAPSVNLTVQFLTNSAELTPAAVHTLDELGRALTSQTLSNYHFRIEGHTDTVGATDHNQALSDARAKRVVEYLVKKFNVDASRLEPVGMGESHPLVQTGDNVSEPRNRRVTVVNLGA